MKRRSYIIVVACVVAVGIIRTTAAQGQAVSKQPATHSAVPEPTHADVKYGPHDRNLMDLWLAESETPTAVLVSIHGGGFQQGDKSVTPGVLRNCLAAGISVAAITYRFTDEVIAPAQHMDGARAIQFIRHKAAEWNIDPHRIGATGDSAGAGISLWLGLHDDLADPDNKDPVLRESTRLTCMAVSNGQTSYDPRFIRELIPELNTYQRPALERLFGVDLTKLDELAAEKYQLFEEVSAINHLTKDDVPVLLMYNSDMDAPVTDGRIGIHHPRFGRVLQEKMNEFGIECQLETGLEGQDASFTRLVSEFMTQHLAAPPIVEENITYGVAEGRELKLDLARPDGEGPFPAILFIHGGGWYAGDRHGYRAAIEEAAKKGYAAATVTYRLMQFDEAEKETTTATTIFPAQIHDVKAAVRWLRANADKYHIDPSRIGATGRSAGGHLSLLLGLTDDESQLEGDSGNPDYSSRVQAVVNVFGPTDMKGCYETSSVAWIFRLVMGGTPEEAAETYVAASPINYVSADDPPVLTLQGDQDKLVPLAQAKSLDERMRAAGATHTLIVFKGQGHGFGGEYRRQEMDAMWRFFDEQLRPSSR